MDFANGFHLTQHIGPNYLGGQLDSDARTAIHMTHRLGAGLVTVVLLLPANIVLSFLMFFHHLAMLFSLLEMVYKHRCQDA